jgi:hypothetical protein
MKAPRSEKSLLLFFIILMLVEILTNRLCIDLGFSVSLVYIIDNMGADPPIVLLCKDGGSNNAVDVKR